MIRYSNKVIKEKMSIKCPHIADAIQYKNKLNKMIITNGTLFFFSHIPEFAVTLVVSFLKTPDFVKFCSIAFDCYRLTEMAQTFHFISIGFQFFILFTFDHNFKKSFRDSIMKKASCLLNNRKWVGWKRSIIKNSSFCNLTFLAILYYH